MIKTRFCPSPTGHMHIGNARTALFNVLLAASQKGHFLLRIEDTDPTRSKEIFTTCLMEDLKWLGCLWDEGPGAEKDKGPYFQSKRQAIYNNYYEKLLKVGLAYPCFCSEEQLALNRKVARLSGKPPRYPGTCRNLTAKEIDKKTADGLPATLRFKMPTNHRIVFEDFVKGEQLFESDDIGDFIIRRQDGTAPFLFCNAVDDALMGVTHVMRGEDHLANTPRQLMILESLHLAAPRYGHMALILGDDGAPLSKRNGSQSISDLRQKGYLPLALVNYFGRLGHYYGHDNWLTLDALGAEFNIEKLSVSPARMDWQQLKFWQKQGVLQLSLADLWQWCSTDPLTALVPAEKQKNFCETVQPNILFPEDALVWAKAFFAPNIEYGAAEKTILQAAGVAFFETAIEALTEVGMDFKALANVLKSKLEVKGKNLFMPLRVALTGERAGPEMAHILPLMGTSAAKARFEAALNII